MKVKCKAKQMIHKAFGVLLSVLMIFSCVNIAGFQSVFAANIPLNAQATTDKIDQILIPNVWDQDNVYGFDVNLNNTKAFSYNVSGQMDNNIHMDRELLEENKGNIRQILNWYYTNPSNQNFWICQTLIWGLQAGKINNYTGDAVLPEIQKVFNAVGINYDESVVRTKVNEISTTVSTGTYYVYSYKTGYVQLLTNNAGTVPTANYATVSSTQIANRDENIIVRVNKTDVNSHNPLSGAKFEFWKDGIKETTITTDVNGIAEYTFTELISKTRNSNAEYCTNYDLLSPKNQQLSISNGQYSSKTDAQTAADESALTLAQNDCRASNSGEHVYKVIETQTKEAYYLNTSNNTFEKALTGQYDANTTHDGIVTFDITNAPQTGIINITKTDSQNRTKIAGAIYGLYASEDIFNPDGSGTKLYDKDDLVKQFPATDENGSATLTNLYLGNYYIQEITAPDGYNLDNTQYSISLNYSGQDVNVITKNIGVSDEWQSGTIAITKVDDENNTPIENAIFELYALKDIKHPDKSGSIIYNAGDYVATFPATDSQGQSRLTGLYLGEYYVKEIQTATNYYCDKSPRNIILNYAGQNVNVSVVSPVIENHRQEGKLTITQSDSETNQPVPGAIYELYADENINHPDGVTGQVYAKDELVATFNPTDSNGQATLDQLYLGSYYIVLKTAPNGYIYSENRQNVEFIYTGQDININPKQLQTENTVQRGTVSIVKKDKQLSNESIDFATKYDTNGDGAQADATLKGATYGLYAKSDITHKDAHTGTVLYDSAFNSINEIKLLKGTDLKVFNNRATADTLIATAKTDENGEISFGHLYLGDYYIKEIEASTGYKLDDTQYDVSLTYAGQNTQVTSVQTSVYEEIMKQAFDILKVGNVPNVNGTTKPLRNVHFEVKLESDIQRLVNQGLSLEEAKEQAPLYDELITNRDGLASSIELPYGLYRVMETIPAVDHNPSQDIFVNIETDSRTHLNLTNSPIVNELFFANIQIIKTDLETNKKIKLPNAEFKIKAITDCYVDGRKFNAGEYIGYQVWNPLQGFWVNTWTSDENGTISLDHAISAGVYSLEEIHAPQGYVLDETPVQFQITTETLYELNENGEPLFKVYKENEPVKTQITVQNTGEVLVGFENGQFIYEERGLANAKYQIIAKENIIDPCNDGTILYARGEIVATLTTGANGTVVSEKLPLGEYTIKEILSPHGYVLNTETQNIKSDYKDETTSLISKTVSFNSERQHYVVESTKLDKETNQVVQGAEFSVYANEDIYNADNQIIVVEGTQLTTAITNENGKTVFNIDFPTDYDFYMLETKAPLGYVSTTQREDYDTNYTSQDDDIIKISKTYLNAPTIVEIAKEDATTHVLPAGTKMYILDSEGVKVDSWTTEQGKTHIIKRLHVNEQYTLVEELASTGYLKANDIQFTVLDIEDVQNYIMSDELVKGKITVEKQGEVLTNITQKDGNTTFIYTDRGLKDAVYEIYAGADIKHPDNESDDFYHNGDLVATITTGEDGKATTEMLPLGKYVVKEIVAPDGYVLNTSIKETSLDYEDQLTAIVTAEVDYHNERQKVEIDTTKLDSKTGEAVQGAEFTLYAHDDITDDQNNVLIHAGEPVETVKTDVDGIAKIKADLPLSVYTMKETKAPVGFNSTDIEYTLDATYQGQDIEKILLSYEFKNIPTKVELTKVDIHTDVKTAGNIMQIFDKDNNLIEEWTTELNESHYIEYLHVGETYTFVEKLASTGYLKANDITFVVEDKGDTGEAQIIEAMKNEHVKGQITVTKKGEVLTGFEDGQFIYEERTLPNAVFKIYAAEDIRHPDGVSGYFYNNGDLVATITTGNDGTATTEQLPLGKYTVIEAIAPQGMVLDTEERSLELVYKDQVTPLVFDSTQCINARQTVEFDLNKLDKETYTLLEGAEFTIYANKDIVNYDNEVIISKDEAITSAISDENGKVIFSIDLPIDIDSQIDPNEVLSPIDGIHGNSKSMFYVKETGRPTGYASIEDIVYVDTTYKGQDAENFIISFDLFNEQTRMTFTLTDKQTGDLVPDAQLSIIPMDDDENLLLSQTFETWITDKNGHIVKGLEPGKYVLRQTLGNARDLGYVTANDVKFEVLDTANMQYTNMIEDFTHTTFELNDEKGKGIKGAIMSIVPVKEDGQFVLGEAFETWETNGEAHEIKYLPIGEYALLELTAPDGYVKAKPILFDVRDTSNVQEYVMVNKCVEFSVKDSTNGTYLSNAEILVKDEDGNIIDKWMTKNTSHIINGLEEGHEYTISQLLAPDTYVTAVDMVIKITTDKKSQAFDMLNKQVDVMKVNVNKKAIKNATLQVINSKTKDVVDQWTSTEKTHYVNGLHEGMSYMIREVQAPNEYVVSSDLAFSVSKEKSNESFVMIDKQIFINKIDENGNALKGSELQIINSESNEVVDSWTTDGNAHIACHLKEGVTYILREVKSPTGYKVADPIEFYVDNVKENQTVVMKDELILTDIVITLSDSETNKPIINKDFIFNIYEDEACTQLLASIHADTKNGTVTFKDIPYGTYYIKQLSSPEGYKISTEIVKIVVDENFTGVETINNIAIAIINEPLPSTVVNTGDNSHLLGLTAILLTSGFLIVLIIKRKNREEA